MGVCSLEELDVLKHLRRSQTLHEGTQWEHNRQGHEVTQERLFRVQSCAVSIYGDFQDPAR